MEDAARALRRNAVMLTINVVLLLGAIGLTLFFSPGWHAWLIIFVGLCNTYNSWEVRKRISREAARREGTSH